MRLRFNRSFRLLLGCCCLALAANCRADEAPAEVRRFTGFVAPVSQMAVSPDGRFLTTASSGRSKDGKKFGDARLWDLATGQQLLKVADEPNTEIWSVAFHPSGRQFVALGLRGDQHIGLLFETATGKQLSNLSEGAVRVSRDLVFVNGGAEVVNNSDQRILIAHGVTGRPIRKFGEVPTANSLAISPDERMVACGVDLSGTNAVHVWELGTGKPLMQTGKLHWAEQIQFSHDNRRMFIGSFQSSELWDVERFQRVAELGNETRGVFSPNGQVLLTANPKCLLSLRDGVTGQSLISFSGGEQYLSSLAFLPDGRHVMCSGGQSLPEEIGKPSSKFDIRMWKLPDSVVARAVATPESTEPAKPVAPTRDELKLAREEIRRIFESDFAKAKKPEAKGELARAMLGHSEKADLKRDRFAFLEEARELAMAGGEVEAATQALEQLAEFDGAGIANKQVDSVRALTVSVKDPMDLTKLGQYCLDAIIELSDAEEFTAALEIVKSANTVGVKSKDQALRDKLKQQQDRISWLKKLSEEAEQARETLKPSPDDATANDRLGRYLCLARQDWEMGLAHLAAGNDAKWKAVAAADRGTSADAAKQVETADAWFELSKSAKTQERSALLSRAKHWYELAAPNTTGLSKVRVETRLKEIDKSSDAVVPNKATSPKSKADPKAKAGAKPVPRERTGVDLRPEFERRGIAVREQGKRGSCQVFAFVAPLEFQLSKSGRPADLSEQFLMWAANDASRITRIEGHNPDHLIRGLQKHGICSEQLMPYIPRKEPLGEPRTTALKDAAIRKNCELVSIKHWQSDIGFGADHMQSLIQTLDKELPVTVTLCWPSGLPDEQIIDRNNVLLDRQVDGTDRSGHGVVLVGYALDAATPGGGYFIVRNSWGRKFANNGYVGVTFDYARRYGIDAYFVRVL